MAQNEPSDEGHYFTGYTLDELWTVWDQDVRPVEWQTLYKIMTGHTLTEIPHITPEDRVRAELRAGRRVICSACGEIKLRNEYYADKRKVNGLYSECKTCHRRIVYRREIALRQPVKQKNLKAA